MSNHQPLSEYFSTIIQPTVKELTMFDNVKVAMQSARDKFTSLWTKPCTTFVDNSNLMEEHESYWAFEMYTGTWEEADGTPQPAQHTVLIEPHEGTWMQVLDQILDVMNEHYGYNIKEQVYYSVRFPLNEICTYTNQPFAGYGRSLNDDVLQQLLLAHPEIYEAVPFGTTE